MPPGVARSAGAEPGGAVGTAMPPPGTVASSETANRRGAAEMRALYPDAARRAGLEGDVRLELEVSATGEVTGSRVVRSAGNGFDEVAQRLVRRFRFRPATRGGKAVPATVPWTYKFRLEG